MLWKYSIILLLCSNCCVYCNLDEDVDAEITKAKQNIMKVVVKAIYDLNECADNFDESVKGLIEGSLERTEEMVLNATTKIKYLVKLAKENGSDVAECVQNLDNDMKKVMNRLKEAGNECVSDKKSKIDGVVINVSHEVNFFRVLLLNIFEGDLRVCKGSDNCLGDLLMRVVNTRYYVPPLVKKRSSEMKTIMENLESGASECSEREEMYASHVINEIIVDSALCVHKVIPELRLKYILKFVMIGI
ncbi:PREDICTED: uncharacterized protein LOC108561180 [Nicrophorus vespilloides]|uniref:Uncharacterized protein LOC108561180 n=1 Tax=Nicrophorus vespilloides TaxID=110193 RepID=A0ABM1MIT7_NICVS|nr:PREDICTED: uncharacterized protein LOC108561180 [Nicrophorus vespilloides]